jgi:hypothetical protein
MDVRSEVVVRHQRIFIESCDSAVCSTVYIVAGLERGDGCSQRGTLRDSLWVQSFPPSQEEQGGQVYQEQKWCGQGPSWERQWQCSRLMTGSLFSLVIVYSSE